MMFMLLGYIDAEEIMVAFGKMGVHIDRQEAEKLLKRCVLYCVKTHLKVPKANLIIFLGKYQPFSKRPL